MGKSLLDQVVLTKDKPAEKRVKLLAWIQWKFAGWFYVIFGIVGFFIVLGQFSEKNPNQTPENWANLLLMPFYFVVGILFLWIGKALERLRPWARWITAGLVFLNLLSILVIALVLLAISFPRFSLPKLELKLEYLLILWLSLFILLNLGYYLWALRALFDKRAKKIFSSAYRQKRTKGELIESEKTPSLSRFDRWMPWITILGSLLLILGLVIALATETLPKGTMSSCLALPCFSFYLLPPFFGAISPLVQAACHFPFCLT